LGRKPERQPVVHGPDEPDAPTQKIVIKLADGKERTFQHISGTSFWDAGGKPISAQQFVEQLFGKLPELFRDEDELRRIWSDPDTRKALVEGLAERGFAGEQLEQIRRMIDAEASDLFDVLRYIAFTKAPLKRAERVEAHRFDILSDCDPKQAEFLDFVLSQYVSEGEGELDPEKLPGLLNVKYGSSSDGVRELGGNVRDVQRAFRGFQGKLYSEERRD
jgi:type I restriction enzyme R subunit